MAKKVRIVAAQLGPSLPTKEKNVRRMIRLVEGAAAKGAKIVCFPELALTPYFPANNSRRFEHYFDVLPDPLTEPLFEVARAAGIAFILSYAERDGVCFYNSALIVDSDGRVAGKYRKVHLPGNFPGRRAGVSSFEKMYFTPGNLGFPVFSISGVRIGVQICYDRQYPEGFRCLALGGAEIVFVPTVLALQRDPSRAETWSLVLRTRAIENGMFIVGVGKAGCERGMDHVGRSVVISPVSGRILAKAKSDGDELIVADLDLNEVTEARRRLPFWRDRRPAEYALLVGGPTGT